MIPAAESRALTAGIIDPGYSYFGIALVFQDGTDRHDFDLRRRLRGQKGRRGFSSFERLFLHSSSRRFRPGQIERAVIELDDVALVDEPVEIVRERHLRALSGGGVRIGDGELFGELLAVDSWTFLD